MLCGGCKVRFVHRRCCERGEVIFCLGATHSAAPHKFPRDEAPALQALRGGTLQLAPTSHQKSYVAATRGSAEMGCINTKPAYFDSVDGFLRMKGPSWDQVGTKLSQVGTNDQVGH